jgi:hypothetical protein
MLSKVMDRSLHINAFLLICIVMFALLYVWQINVAAGSGFEMSELQTRIDNLRIANQQLEYRAAENRAMYSVSRKVSILGMVRPDEVSYVSVEAPAVALNK